MNSFHVPDFCSRFASVLLVSVVCELGPPRGASVQLGPNAAQRVRSEKCGKTRCGRWGLPGPPPWQEGTTGGFRPSVPGAVGAWLVPYTGAARRLGDASEAASSTAKMASFSEVFFFYERCAEIVGGSLTQ